MPPSNTYISVKIGKSANLYIALKDPENLKKYADEAKRREDHIKQEEAERQARRAKFEKWWDSLSDDENKKAWTYIGTTMALATLTVLFRGIAIEAYDYETAMTMGIMSGISATSLLTVDIISIVDAVKTAKRKNRMYQDVWEKKKL